jgi:CDP-paratose 2-epimerase
VKIYITGIGGLIGSTVAEEATKRGHKVWGTDCDNRGRWYGHKGSVQWRLSQLSALGVRIHTEDYRQRLGLVGDADLIVHCAGQASHDWSRTHPVKDFQHNAMGTVELLEAIRNLSPQAVVVFLSTNKVYGDRVNAFSYVRGGERLVPALTSLEQGIAETFPVDHTLHTPFGVSKLAADLMFQEFRRCYGMKTVTFRCGCLTGPGGTAVELQGFLGYLVKCAVSGEEYVVYGHEGYQVRDNIDATDVADAILRYAADPKQAVYNMGGGPANSISVREAVDYLMNHHGLNFQVLYNGPARVGDHKFWITDTGKFEADYPGWTRKPLKEIIDDLVTAERRKLGLLQPDGNSEGVHSGTV